MAGAHARERRRFAYNYKTIQCDLYACHVHYGFAMTFLEWTRFTAIVRPIDRAGHSKPLHYGRKLADTPDE